MPAAQGIVPDSKPAAAPLSEGKGVSPSPDAKSGTRKSAPRRRRREGQAAPMPNGEERFFLADGDGDRSVPALGRECPNESDAVIEAFRAKLTFYRVSEFQTRAEIGPSG